MFSLLSTPNHEARSRIGSKLVVSAKRRLVIKYRQPIACSIPSAGTTGFIPNATFGFEAGRSYFTHVMCDSHSSCLIILQAVIAYRASSLNGLAPERCF